MKGTPFSERIVASIGFSERQSGLPNPTRHAFVPVSTVEGPWAFALPLPPTGDIASASP